MNEIEELKSQISWMEEDLSVLRDRLKSAEKSLEQEKQPKQECNCYYTKFCKSTMLKPNEYCRDNGK